MNWVLDNLGLIGSLTLDHLRQSTIAIVAAFVFFMVAVGAASLYAREPQDK